MYTDFAEIKATVSFGQIIGFLNLNLRQRGNQWRGPCPACQSGGERALVITEGKGFYCFATKKGGDQIALVAHIKDVAVKEAAEQIARHTGTGSRNNTSAPEPGKVQVRGECPILTYLEPADERVQALGVTFETARELASGYAPKGVLRGFYAVPVRNPDGALKAYVGIAVAPDQEQYKFFSGFDRRSAIFGADRVTDGTLTLLRSPLDVILALQNGADNCVAFLTETIFPDQLEQLAIFMQERGCEHLELF
jgi:DNA primase